MRALAILIALCGVAGAEGKLADLQFFVGEWRCEMRAQGARPQKASMKVTRELEGAWYVLHFSQGPARGIEYWGWDAASKSFRALSVSNSGGWENGTSPGWEGDRFVWTGEATEGATRAPLRATITRTGERAFTNKIESGGANGSWTLVGDASCVR
jgi:hypothetical protein